MAKIPFNLSKSEIYSDSRIQVTPPSKKGSSDNAETQFYWEKLTERGKMIEDRYEDLLKTKLCPKEYQIRLGAESLTPLEIRSLSVIGLNMGAYYGFSGMIFAPPNLGKTTAFTQMGKSFCAYTLPYYKGRYVEPHKKFDKIYILSCFERYKEIIDLKRSIMSIPEDIKDVKSVDEFSKPEFDHVKFIRTDKVFGNPTTGEAGVVDVLINAKKDVLDGLDVLVMVDSITHAVVAYSDLYPFDATLEGSGYKASVGNPFVSWWYHAAQQFTKGSLTLLTTNLDKPRSKTDLINDTALAAGDYHIYLSSEAFYTRDDKHRIITSIDPVLSNQRVVSNFPQIRINKSGEQYIVPEGASTRDRILLHAHNWDSTLWD